MKTKYEYNEYLNVDVIESFLKEKGITKKEFATLLRKAPQTVSGYLSRENPHPFPKDKESRNRLCEVTGKRIEQLLIRIRINHDPNTGDQTPSDKVADEDRRESISQEIGKIETARIVQNPGKEILDPVPEKTENDIEDKSDNQNNVTIIVTVRDSQKDYKTRIHESRKKIIGGLVLVALILCIIFLQVEFNLFGGIAEDRLVNYPCLLFFSIAISLYGARETLVCENDLTAKNMTEKGVVIFGISAFVWLWGVTFIRVLLETAERGRF